MLADQCRERVQLGREHRMPPVTLLARGDFAGFPPPLFEPPDPGGTDAVFARDRGRLHVAIVEHAFAEASNRRAILLQDVARRSTMNRLSSTRAFRKTL